MEKDGVMMAASGGGDVNSRLWKLPKKFLQEVFPAEVSGRGFNAGFNAGGDAEVSGRGFNAGFKAGGDAFV